MVDKPDLGSGGEIREGSSPSARTKLSKWLIITDLDLSEKLISVRFQDVRESPIDAKPRQSFKMSGVVL